MAQSALKIIKDAMSKINMYPDEASIPASEAEHIKRALNFMMADWETKGWKLGFTEIDSTSEPVTVPNGALKAIIYNLAAEISPDYNEGEVSMQVGRIAKASLNTIRRMTVKLPVVALPDTLPIGSGNYDGIAYTDNYYGLGDPLLLVSNTGLTVTIATADTPVVIGSNWSDDSSNLFTVTAAGRATYTGKYRAIEIQASIFAEVASGTDDLTFYIARNGVPYENSAVTVSSTAGTDKEIKLVHTLQLWKDDYIELWGKNNDTTENITINSAKYRTT